MRILVAAFNGTCFELVSHSITPLIASVRTRRSAPTLGGFVFCSRKTLMAQ
jgi:hypothetical protein